MTISDCLANLSAMWSLLLSVAFAMLVFVLIRRLLFRSVEGKSLDQRITDYMPQNLYGSDRGVKKSSYYKPGHEK